MKKVNSKLFVIDSADGSGKTKLSQFLIEKYRFNYWHHGIYPNVEQAHNDCINSIKSDIDNYKSNWICDRLHLSEYIYGTLFRNGPAYNFIDFNEKLKNIFKQNYKLIICLPSKEAVMKKHSERLSLGDEAFNTVDKVYDAYKALSKNIELNPYIYNFEEDADYSKISEWIENENI